jgi:hypothetical protein
MISTGVKRKSKRSQSKNSRGPTVFDIFLRRIKGNVDLDKRLMEKLQHRANHYNGIHETHSKSKSYHMFTSDEKLFTLELLRHFEIDEVCKLTFVPKKSVIRWRNVGHLRAKGCGRKPQIPWEVNKKLIEYYEDSIVLNNTRPRYQRMKELALKLCKHILPMFKASKGWWEKWRIKHFGHVGRLEESRVLSASSK